MKLSSVSKAIVGLSACCVSQVFAGGFYLSEFGTPASLGTGGAGNTTNNIGADSSFTNPAGMTGIQQDEILTGIQLLVPEIKFDASVAEAGGTDGGNVGDLAVVPSFFYVNKLPDNLWFGFSITGPLGGGMDFGSNFVGRYGAQEVVLQGLALSPSLGYKVNDQLSLGVGIAIVYSLFEEKIAINQSALGPLSPGDGQIRIEDADDWGYQPFLGLTYQVNDRMLIGVVYRAEMDVELEGDLKFRNVALPFTETDVEIDWDNPQLLEIGLKYEVKEGVNLLINADWEDWSQFSKNRLGIGEDFSATLDRKWKDTWHVAVAVATRRGDHAFTTGFSYDSSPVDDSDRTIDLPMDEQVKFSAAYVWKGDKKLDFGIGATLMWMGDGKVDQTAQGVRFKGKFDTNYILFMGATLRYQI